MERYTIKRDKRERERKREKRDFDLAPKIRRKVCSIVKDLRRRVM